MRVRVRVRVRVRMFETLYLLSGSLLLLSLTRAIHLISQSRYINSNNRAGLNFSLAPNELTDITEEEFAAYKGLLINPSEGDEELMKREMPEFTFADPNVALPTNLDWRQYGEFSYNRVLKCDVIF